MIVIKQVVISVYDVYRRQQAIRDLYDEATKLGYDMTKVTVREETNDKEVTIKLIDLAGNAEQVKPV